MQEHLNAYTIFQEWEHLMILPVDVRITGERHGDLDIT